MAMRNHPFLIGDTSSFMILFSLSGLFSGVCNEENPTTLMVNKQLISNQDVVSITWGVPLLEGVPLWNMHEPHFEKNPNVTSLH